MKKLDPKPRKKSALKPGDHVVTNDRYAAIVGTTHEGELVRESGDRVWMVLVWARGHDIRVHPMHESMMEKWSEEHVGTITKDKPVKLSGMLWQKTNRDQWVCEAAGARIRQLDAVTFSVTRSGRYLGSERSLDAAAERAELNKMGENNARHYRMWDDPNRPPPQPDPPASSALSRGADAAARQRVRAEVAARSKPAAKASGQRGERDSELLTLLARGCTREEILRVTGWKAVSVQQLARTLGVGLRVEDGAKPYKYFSTEEVS